MTPLSRRRFLAGLGAAATLVPSRRGRAASLSFGPAAFDVTSSAALVWLRASAGASVRIEYGTRADLAGAALTAPVAPTEATDYTAVTNVAGLAADTEYFYRGVVSHGGGEWVRGAVGRFRTAPAVPREFQFAWSGDMEAGHRPYAILDHVTALRPDFFLMVGDTMYADFPKEPFVASLAHYRFKHRENREDGALQRMLAGLPVAAIWDDHEILNDADHSAPGMREARQAFREYWPVRSADTLYRRFAWSSAAEFFVLDCRSYRSPKTQLDGAGKTMLGAAQKGWLKDGLAASTATFKFVVSSIPFLPPSRVDSWSGYATERQEILDFLRGEHVRNVVVLSADIHLALDYDDAGVQEYVAGPIGAWPACPKPGRHRQALERSGRFFICDQMNFGAITVRPQATPPHLETRFVDAAGVLRYRKVTQVCEDRRARCMP